MAARPGAMVKIGAPYFLALLLQRGATVRVGVRHPGRVKMAADWAKAPEIVQADIMDDKTVDSAITGAGGVVNLVGILTEAAAQRYRAIHVEGARRVALAAQRLGVTRLIHISALGASPTSPAISDRTKAERHSRDLPLGLPTSGMNFLSG